MCPCIWKRVALFNTPPFDIDEARGDIGVCVHGAHTVSTILICLYTHFWDCHIASILSISNWIFYRILFVAVCAPFLVSTSTFAFRAVANACFYGWSGVRVCLGEYFIDFSLNFEWCWRSSYRRHIYRTQAIYSLISIQHRAYYASPIHNWNWKYPLVLRRILDLMPNAMTRIPWKNKIR